MGREGGPVSSVAYLVQAGAAQKWS